MLALSGKRKAVAAELEGAENVQIETDRNTDERQLFQSAAQV
jgi:hypothetical protein